MNVLNIRKDVPDNSILCRHWLQLLDELNIGAFTVDQYRSLTSINLSAQALLGLRSEEVIGKDCREVFVGVPCMVKCLLSGGDGFGHDEPDVEFFDETDTRHLISRLATPMFDADRNTAGCLTILLDHSPIADLVDRVHYEERSLKIILDNINVGLFTVNRGGLITFFNTEAEKISGYGRREVIGTHCVDLFGGKASKDLSILMRSMREGDPHGPEDGEIFDVDGVAIPIRANYMALKNEKGAIVGGLATFQDITLVHQLKQAISNRYTYHDMIGKEPCMQKIFEMLDVVANSEATILIEGATGTGKDLLAKVIHSTGKRADRPMVKVNCAAIPGNLIESEMFGYIKGAFTGADRDKPGRFQEADGGTLFLDEIGDLPLRLQAKLLRVVEDQEFYPLGSRKTTKVDVRILAATNQHLEGLVAKGLFREDLFYRLNVLRIELPPLKERRADIPLLVRHIMRYLCTVKGCRSRDIAEGAMEILLNYDYPGNVRELENIMEYALTVCRKEVVAPRDLPIYVQSKDVTGESSDNYATNRIEGDREKERSRLMRALNENNWHRKKTAQAMGIDRTTLWRRMKMLKIEKYPGMKK